MSARAPQAIWNLWYAIHRQIPESELGGIVGDVAHSFGYHLARRDLPASDYSVQLPKDKLGKSDCASALDVTLPPDLMQTCTRRLLDAAKAHDPRLHAVREFCGTLDGKQTFPWQLTPTDGGEGVGTWDDSHLWHIHISILREYADDQAALLPIADVFAGTPLVIDPTDPKWSSKMDRAEVIKAASEGVRDEIDAALRAFAHGGDHGDFTPERLPNVIKAAGEGALDRIRALEKAAGK